MPDYLVIVMPYDRDSFLAGIAAGRNMRSWPIREHAEAPGVFQFTVWISEEHTSSIFYFSAAISQGWIDWGDGTTQDADCDLVTATLYAAPDHIRGVVSRYQHTYEDGVYQIRIYGDLLAIKIGATDVDDAIYKKSALAVISVDSKFPTIRESIPRPILFNGNNLCGNCHNLSSLPPGLCDNLSIDRDDISIPALDYWFQSCRSLFELPERLFGNIRILPTTSGRVAGAHALFSDCRNLRQYPDDLFSGGGFAVITNAMAMLAYVSADLKPHMLDKFTGLNIADQMLRGSGARGCRSIPQGFFDELRSLTRVDALCYENKNLLSVPTDLFDNCPNVTNFYLAFYNCTNLESNVPTLWVTHPDANGDSCFKGCTNAANYNEIPASWGGTA